jgi:cytochrome P450
VQLPARRATRDVALGGAVVPAGAFVMVGVGAANRDPAVYDRPTELRPGRDGPPHVAFGHGIHFCLGAALARLEGRVALEEVLRRFPEWTVDLEQARLSPTSTVRGWETLPVRF